MPAAKSLTGRVAVLLACVIVAGACSHTVNGHPRTQSAPDRGAPIVQPADLGALLLSDAELSTAIGVPGMVTHDPYTTIVPPQGETYSDPSCAEAVFNTMYTAYDGIDYTGVAGRQVAEPGDRPQHDSDQGVVSFGSADEAHRFVVRTLLGWDRCADARLSVNDNKPGSPPDTYTVGFAATTGDIPTLLISPEAGNGRLCQRAITSRSNVVIDIYVCGAGVTAEQAVAVTKSIANKMPH
jgi:hypothetical protein